MTDESRTTFIQIRPEGPENYQHTDTMNLLRPCILILGGENTVVPNLAYNYGITIANTLNLNNIKGGLDIYSAYYNLDGRNSNYDRLNLFRDFRPTESLLHYGKELRSTDICKAANTTFPFYIYDIFNFAFKPRLFGPDHQMLKPKKIEANFRNMLVYTHCHGAYVLRMLETLVHQELNYFKDSRKDTSDLGKNLLVINHAPFAPLENCNFSAVSFCSAADPQISFYNELSYNMRQTPNIFKPAFFGPYFGNIMITDSIKINSIQEHSHVGLSGYQKEEHNLTENGEILFAVERNALLTGTIAMLNKTSVPAIEKLVCAPDKDISFDLLNSRGKQICNKLQIKTK